MLRLVLVVALFVASSGALAAPPIGYAQATGYFKKDSRPTLFQPLNLLDGRENTAWCSTSSDSLGDLLWFGFKGKVTIDEVRLYTGNGFDEPTFQQFSRGKKFVLSAHKGSARFTVEDQRGLQVIPLDPPLEGSQFSFEVLDQFPAEDADAPVCLSDVVFYSEGKPLNGSWLTQKLKYDRQVSALMGTWFAGSDKSPDRFLSFYFDGTFRYSREPFDQPEQAKSYTGAYEVSGNRLALELPEKGRTTVTFARDKVDPRGAHLLELQGEVPEELRRAFRDRP